MKKSILLTLLLLSASLTQAKIIPTQLRCEYLNDPPVVDVLYPRLSWINIAGPGEPG